MTRKEKNLNAIIGALGSFQDTLVATRGSINKPISKIGRQKAKENIDNIIRQLQEFKAAILKDK